MKIFEEKKEIKMDKAFMKMLKIKRERKQNLMLKKNNKKE